MNTQNKKKWILVDGHNLAFRCFYGVPDMTRSDGLHVNAIYGFIRTLMKLNSTYTPDAICVFFDTDGSKVRKHELSTYKANRKKMPVELVEQIQILPSLVISMGYYVDQHSGIEADDLIGMYAKKIANEDEIAYIASADKDFAQCISKNVFQLLPPVSKSKTSNWKLLDHNGVIEKYGLRPDQMVDYLALIGDSADNIDGIPGVGPKTATKWLKELGTIESIYDNITKISPIRFQDILLANKELVYRNQRLITLQEYNDFNLPSAEHKPDMLAFEKQLQEIGLFSIAREIRKENQRELF
ncbi:MAG: 5'-3' exonuclease [Opitutales bacterium]|nr:5'-3' exonuclease [Opitutales bacterium]